MTKKTTLPERIMILLNELPVAHSTVDLRKKCGARISPVSERSTFAATLNRLAAANKIKKVPAPDWPPKKGGQSHWWISTKWTRTTGATVSLDDAKEMLTKGVRFGDVCPLLSIDDQETLKYWFVRSENLPNLAMRTRESSESFGESCAKCGGQRVRTGTCMTCQSCGENEGCG